jgi:hypothetical protein
MENLVQLVASLKKSEVQFIQHYYKQDTDKKRLQFFNAVLSGEIKTDEAAAKKFYGKKGAAYSQLKSRLIKDLMNLLLFEEGSKQSESELFQNEVEVLRNIIMGKILFLRKVHNLSFKQWDLALNISKDYELFSERILVKSIMSSSLGIKQGIDEFNKSLEDIDSDIDLQRDLVNATKIYYEVALPNTFYKNNENEFIKVAQLGIENLRNIYNKSKSPKIGYYYYLTAINFYSITKEYKELYNISVKFFDLVNNSKSINSNSRMVNALMQVFSASMYLGNYSESFINATKALGYTVKNGINELVVLEYLFLSQFRIGEFEILTKIVEDGINHPRIKYNELSNGKWIYYQANFMFLKLDYKHALQELQKENALLKDKSGWLFGHKLLEIMCYIELGEFDMIEFRVEALRKLLQRQKDKNIIRMKTIFSILGTFIKTGASFKNTLALESDKLALLQEGKDEHYWDPLGFEIIRFDTWFAAKAY